MAKIAPSLLEADFKCLQKEMETIENAGADYAHFDIMDGNFVPNLSFGIKMIKSIRDVSNLTFDVHMMVVEPIRFLDQFKSAGADIITVHYEACKDMKLTLSYIKKIGLKAGIALNPETSVDVLSDDIIKLADVIQIMTVKPGIPNQSFIYESLDKIKKVNEHINGLKLERDIEVDGGINLDNIGEVIKAGANIIVSGKALFNGDIKENIKCFKKEMDLLKCEV